jgi:hypothetical protein
MWCLKYMDNNVNFKSQMKIVNIFRSLFIFQYVLMIDFLECELSL